MLLNDISIVFGADIPKASSQQPPLHLRSYSFAAVRPPDQQ
jgi:hypothetical protein